MTSGPALSFGGEESGWTTAEPNDIDEQDSPDTDKSGGDPVHAPAHTACDQDDARTTSSSASTSQHTAAGSQTPPTPLSSHRTTLLLPAVVTARKGQEEPETTLPDDTMAHLRALDGVVAAGVWVVGPCPVPVGVWTLAELTADVGRVPDCLVQHGMAVVQDALSTTQVADLHALVHDRIRRAENAIKESGRNLIIGEDEFAFCEMASRGRHRFDLLLDLSSDELQRVDKAWRAGVAAALDCDPSAVRVQVSAVYSRPGAPDQDWHSDGAHLDRDGGWGSTKVDDGLAPASPYAVCVFVPLVDLTATTGYTSFWPGSHRHAGLLGFGPAATAIGTEVDGVVSAGTALVYDYRLLHRGRANVGTTQRELLQFLYSRDYIEAKNYGKTKLLS
eukprot:m.157767 g.157767  ORF g.157767 m.157767 type:complete len:390 (-) comp11731_c1_seq4:3326-4495(-)